MKQPCVVSAGGISDDKFIEMLSFWCVDFVYCTEEIDHVELYI